MRLILASASPRRAEILRNAGFVFDIHPSEVDETRFPNEQGEDCVQRLADKKARFAAEYAAARGVPALVIAADTVVVAGTEILGKPADLEDARRMLRLLNGSTHEVLTAVVLIRTLDGLKTSCVETTRVSFAPLTESDLERYLITGESFDKAGAYGIQGIGGRFAWRIEGCYFNVMGLPISRVWAALKALGWKDPE